ncbi:C-GCAxxG-C-C family (seleno)protein [Sinanaerobacter chloroacetimidivorans]|uniref:C-GCAxxG-C-C family protein n=1 Tax=Sinanaerobacter chloroacetimidivorans TaxID=2818044 RepID=A0A8J7W3Y5_9FIRM|nr:C-GCAxxG-C-C family (seleno)protein [Sinanaerobacter chloroacetimidivorans]MBR0598505.1 C-GCAxxG-C-C family protein [Sinanaerobacter chloroacetimidivorans]
MSEEMAIEMRNKAGNYFKKGYNCAEAVFLTYRELLAPELDPSLVRLMTGFGGGLGESGCMCGALTGSITALNLIKGRSTNQTSRDEAYQLAREFTDKFTEKYGVTCCRALNPYPFETKEHLTNCLKITGNTSKMLAEFLEEKGLVE